MREYATGAFRWIDFDNAYESSANPFALDLFGLVRLLVCITGKGMHTAHTVREFGLGPVPDREDFSCVHKNEIMNLKKLFPYIPDSLNRTLLHFSAGAEVAYDTVGELVADIRACLPDLLQAVEKRTIAALLQKHQTLAYRKYASALMFFRALHSHIFEQPAREANSGRRPGTFSRPRPGLRGPGT